MIYNKIHNMAIKGEEFKQYLIDLKDTCLIRGISDPVFILDQTFCPNVRLLGEGEILSTVRTISFASGSKFPSGGKCTAGYCIGNEKSISLMDKIEMHLMKRFTKSFSSIASQLK